MAKFIEKLLQGQTCNCIVLTLATLGHGSSMSMDGSIMRGNQLPVSPTRWQHGSQICFATFNELKVTKLLKTQQPGKLEKNKHRFGVYRILENFDVCV